MVFRKGALAFFVLTALMVLRSEVLFLKVLDPAGCLPLQFLEIHEPG
jgi:hypothetical protein